MKLWILRHGEARPQTSSDAARELTAHGGEQVRGSAVHLQGLPLQKIIASPYERARQTAELVRQVLDFQQQVSIAPWLTPDSNPRQVLAELDEQDAEHVLLVSHQPLVGALTGLLVHGSYQHAQPMGTATLVELEGDDILAGGMRLVSVHHA